jgi:hypothetical protein
MSRWMLKRRLRVNGKIWEGGWAAPLLVTGEGSIFYEFLKESFLFCSEVRTYAYVCFCFSTS